MQKLRTQRTFVLTPADQEPGGGKSETVPNETMSIREILTKYSRGQRIDATMQREGKFEKNSSFDSEDLEAASRTSLTDRDEVVDRMREQNDAGAADLKRRQESAAATIAENTAKLKQLDDAKKEASAKKSPPARTTEGSKGEGGYRGRGERENSGESNDEQA